MTDSRQTGASVLEPPVPAREAEEPAEHYVNERGAELLRAYRSRGSQRRRKNQKRLEDASQSRLVWARFRKHRLATIALVLLIAVYGVALLAEFVAPYGKLERFPDTQFATPSRIHVVDQQGSWHLPFVYRTESRLDPETFTYRQVVPPDAQRFTVRLLPKTEPYELAGFVPADRKLFGTTAGGPPVMLLGSDQLGRDLFSRLVHASRVSLLVGLGGVAISFLLGVTLGGISGYFGGKIDAVIQRTIDFIISIPLIPLWMAPLGRDPAGLERHPDLLRDHDDPVPGRLDGARAGGPRKGHLPAGGGLRDRRPHLFGQPRLDHPAAPAAGGHQLPRRPHHPGDPRHDPGRDDAQLPRPGHQRPGRQLGHPAAAGAGRDRGRELPWLLSPALALVFAVVLFNFVGDGLRDAADPYSR